VGAERRLSRGVHRRPTNARQDGGGHSCRADGRRTVGRSRSRVSADAAVGGARRARRARLPDRALRPESSRPSRSLRRDARRPRLSVIARVALAVATVGGIGYAPIAPGTFGSAAGVLVWWLLGPSVVVQSIGIVAIFAAGVWSGGICERHFCRTDP